MTSDNLTFSPRVRQRLEPYSHVIITGASSGIGAALLACLAAAQPALQFINISRSPAKPPSDSIHLQNYACDLGCPEQRRTTAETIRGLLQSGRGHVLLINNSGFGSYGKFVDLDLAHELALMQVNMSAVVDLSHRLLPVLRQRGGSIINVASTAAWQPTPYLATYGSTKAFLLHWSLALNEELRELNIPVMAICPGPTESNFFQRAGFKHSPIGTFGQTAQEVALFTLRKWTKRAPCPVSGCLNSLLAALACCLPKRWEIGRAHV